jgi:hypothetical protein
MCAVESSQQRLRLMVEVQWIALAVVWWLFTVSGVRKAAVSSARIALTELLRRLPGVPGPAARPLVFSLIFAEFAVGGAAGAALVVAGTSLRGGRWSTVGVLVAAVALLAVLTVGVATIVTTGIDARCACFGAEADRLGWADVARDGLLLSIAVFGLVSSIVASPRSTGVTPHVLSAGIGVLLATVLIRLDDVMAIVTTRSPGGSRRSERGTA